MIQPTPVGEPPPVPPSRAGSLAELNGGGAPSPISPPLPVSHTWQASLAVALFYASSSAVLGLTNKSILSGDDAFSGTFTLVLCQLLITILFCASARACLCGNALKIPAPSVALLRPAAPMAALFMVNVGLGLWGLSIVEMPLFYALRRLTTPIILVYESLLRGGAVPEAPVCAAVLLILGGTLVAAWEKMNDDALGYSLTLLANVATAALGVSQRAFSEGAGAGLGPLGLVYVQALLAAPLALAGALATGELRALLPALMVLAGGGAGGGAHALAVPVDAAAISSSPPPPVTGNELFPPLAARIAFASAMGLVMTYATMLSVTHNSPLATSVAGNAKGILTSAAGWAFFAHVETPLSVGGVAISLVGTIVYSVAKSPLRCVRGGAPPHVASNGNRLSAGHGGGDAVLLKDTRALGGDCSISSSSCNRPVIVDSAFAPNSTLPSSDDHAAAAASASVAVVAIESNRACFDHRR